MWPKILDLDAASCQGIRRKLELEAYSGVVSALRVQGELTKERRKILADLSNVLNITPERHKTEVRRAINDELLGTVTKRLTGSLCETEWAREGRRIIPLLRRALPLTAFTSAADSAQVEAENHNQSLKPPLKTKTAKRKTATGNRGLMAPPPPLLKDIIQNGEVNPPSFATPIRPKGKDHEGDVIMLPSGMAVRFKEEPLVAHPDPNNATPSKVRRKRKGPSIPEDEARGSYEVYPVGQFYSQRPPMGLLPGLSSSSTSSPLMYGPKGRKRPKMPPPGTLQPPLPPPPNQQPHHPMGAPSPGMHFMDSHHGYARQFLPQIPSPLSELGAKMAAKYSSYLNPSPKVGPSNNIPPVLPKTPLPPQKEGKTAKGASSTRGKGRGRKQQANIRPSAPTPTPIPPAPSSSSSSFPTSVSSSSTVTTPNSPALTEEAIANSIQRSFNEASGLTPPSSTPTSLVALSSMSPAKIMTSIATLSTLPGNKPRPLTSLSPSMQLKEGVLAPGMKVIPAGARILPKAPVGVTVSTSLAAASGATSLGSAGLPVYMMTSSSTPGQSNVVRMSRAGISPIVNSSQSPNSTTRVVTLNPGAFKTGATVPLSATGVVRPSGNAIIKAAFSSNAIGGTPSRYITTSGARPSLIVLQRGSSGLGGTKGILAGQRIIQTSPGGKPMMIVTKALTPMMTTVTTASATPTSGVAVTATHLATSLQTSDKESKEPPNKPSNSVTSPASSMVETSSQAGNVIVYDMSKESSIKSHVLSDILQATGIVTEESSKAKEGSEQLAPINLATSSKGDDRSYEEPATPNPVSSAEASNQTPRTQVLLTREGLKTFEQGSSSSQFASQVRKANAQRLPPLVAGSIQLSTEDTNLNSVIEEELRTEDSPSTN
ncbi:hypothetical protein TCAL_16926 [Tigriopus californicus]|uniref:ENT domain-containing protein n=1 Tax=Tigriopus californicus TaxID=6832 RepID=A0A553NQP1_TIGCA|nr:hypothetical protein TCAL_16926 [Tigriopus californicus]